jgi:hypothetical protein
MNQDRKTACHGASRNAAPKLVAGVPSRESHAEQINDEKQTQQRTYNAAI